jgi:hypothetical protein
MQTLQARESVAGQNRLELDPNNLPLPIQDPPVPAERDRTIAEACSVLRQQNSSYPRDGPLATGSRLGESRTMEH